MCDQTADCEPPYECREDFSGYRLHKQCTAPCGDAASCGSEGICLDGTACAKTCTDSADCPEGTICKPGGWCERSGPGSGVPYCVGTPTACADLSADDCDSVPGCSTSGECTGSVSSCISRDNNCGHGDGCLWHNGFNECQGQAAPCSTYGSSSTCPTSINCRWSLSCEGEPSNGCENFSVADCEQVPGCTIVSG